MVKHIVMWNVRARSDRERADNIERVKAAFEGIRTSVPGLLHLEVGVDTSGMEYACDVVLYTEFDGQASLDHYNTHPEHLRVRAELEGVRVARHQVDYRVATQTPTVGIAALPKGDS
jgi:riboflavin synthase